MVSWNDPIAFAMGFWAWYDWYYYSTDEKLREGRVMEICGAEGRKVLSVIHPSGEVKEPEYAIVCTHHYEVMLQQEVPQGHLYP